MMRKLIFAIIFASSLLFIFSVGETQDDSKIFYLYLTICKNDTVKFHEFNTMYGTPTRLAVQPREENYTIVMFSKENKVLLNAYLEIGFVVYPFPPEGEPEIEIPVNESQQYIRLPYFEDARKIQILHNGKSIFKFDIPVKPTTTSTPFTDNKTGNIQLVIYVFILIGAVIGIALLLWMRMHRAAVQSPQNLPYRRPY